MPKVRMVTACIKHGKIKQEISLIEVGLAGIFFIIVGAMGSQVVLDINKKKRNICEKYVQYPSSIEIDYEIAYIVCILVSIVFFLVAGYKLVVTLFIEKYIKLSQFFLPAFMLVMGGVTIGLSVMFYNSHLETIKNNPTPLANTDQRIIDYCTVKDTPTENLYVAFTCIFSIGVIAIFLYVYNFVTSICVSN